MSALFSWPTVTWGMGGSFRSGRGPCVRWLGRRTGGAGCSVASGHDAPVDVPDGAGDPAGGRGEQEGDGVGQVAGGADPAERVEAVEAVQGLVQLVGRDEP